ncbi:hypothetical protein MKX03_013639 [Papaver bracteatum]|nr:hypothetical protein MKX03_013639 [Papaver bracteatum]
MKTSNRVCELHYGKDSFLKDVQFGTLDWLPASCHDAGIPAGVIAYVRRVLPVGMTNSTAVEDNNKGEVSMANSTAIEKNKEGKVGMSDSTPTEENKEDESHFHSSDKWRRWLLSDDEWVGKELERRRRWTWINVYAYYDNEEGYGGYGVVLRNALAKPLVASAKFSENGISFFHQALMGIKAGVELAERRKLSDFHVQCNSSTLPALFRNTRRCSNKKCLETRDPFSICRGCKTYYSSFASCGMLLISLGLELRGNAKIVDFGSSWGRNKAARYLAKSSMNERREVEIQAVDFPEELRDIIWKDACLLPDFFKEMGSAGHEDSAM